MAPEQVLQEGIRAGERQGVQADLGVVGFTAPAVLILRTVSHQEHKTCWGQAIDEAIEQGLRLRIDPVQVLTDQQQRLHLAPRSSTRFRALSVRAALRRVEVRSELSVGSTSRSESSAGMVSWSSASSVKTCPVTLARMVRTSSPSST